MVAAVPNMENSFEYTSAQFDLVSHALTIGYAAQAAGFVYFGLTIPYVSQKHKMANIYGMLVMTSAFFLLYSQWKAWIDAFSFSKVDGVYSPKDDAVLFSNGYRYLNWSIDVPLLLLQLILVSGTEIRQGLSNPNFRVAAAGLMMIYIGYIGQFFENKDEPGVLIGCGIVGCFFYLIMLYLVLAALGQAKVNLPSNCQGKVKMVGVVYVVFWTIYPISYFMPVISYTATGVVVRQFVYTIADVVSKVIYGIILTQISLDVAKFERKTGVSGEGLNESLAR